MKILTGIPTNGGATHTLLSIESVLPESDVLVIDNGSDDLTKIVLIREDITVIENETNLYVTQAWNQILEYFLMSEEYETLIIMNSDLIMKEGWSKVLNPEQICIPTDGSHRQDVVVTEGTPGVFIHLSREMAEMIYPIPNFIKIWFNDNFIFGVLRGLGFQTVVKAGLLCEHYHGGSQSVNTVPDKEEIIEQDKKNWSRWGEKFIEARISVCQK